MVVWKYPMPFREDGRVSCNMPCGARFLSLQVQRGVPRLWVMVDPDQPMEPRAFRWVGTGHDLVPDAGEYVGTVQYHGDDLVFHLFATQPAALAALRDAGGAA